MRTAHLPTVRPRVVVVGGPYTVMSTGTWVIVTEDPMWTTQLKTRMHSSRRRTGRS